MRVKKLISVLTVMILVVGVMSGCGNNKNSDGKDSLYGDQITLEYWTWFPSKEQGAEAIEKFEEENPNIKINMTVMESRAFQEKVPLALSTQEDIDIIGVQPSAFAEQVAVYLADLDPLMEEATGSKDWKTKYSQNSLKQGNELTEDKTKMLVLVNAGSVIGYVNMELLHELGGDMPQTIEEYKILADKLREKYPDKYAGVFAGKEAWVCDEMLLTILGQQGDYFNKWRYENAPVDSPEYKQALDGMKQYFDEGIFSTDIMDLDYAGASEVFGNGDALVYYMGSWESPLLSPTLREKNGVNLSNVGAMALPTVEKDGQPAVRGYLDCGIGIVDESEKKEAAAKFVAYMTIGEGADILSNQLLGPSGKVDCETDMSLFQTEDEKKRMADSV